MMDAAQWEKVRLNLRTTWVNGGRKDGLALTEDDCKAIEAIIDQQVSQQTLEKAGDDVIGDLKLCPFCGGEAEIDTWSDQTALVICGRCFSSTRYFDTETEAIKAWNRRA